MSNARIFGSKLHTWEGPVFPQAVIDLHAAYAAFFGHIDGSELLEAAEKVQRFVGRSGQEPASDGYCGFWTFTFAVNGGLVAIRFPCFDDEEQKDGTTTDRCVAAYRMSHLVCTDEVARVASEFREQLEAHPLFGHVAPPPVELETIL